MKAILINHIESYAVKEMIMAYFPHMKIEVTSDIPEDEDYVISELKKNGKEFIYQTVIYYKKQRYENTLIKFDYNKTYFKQSFYIIAKDIFGFSLPWGVLTGIRPSKIVRELSEKGMSESDIKSYFLSHYMTSEKKAELAIKVAKKEQTILNDMDKNAVSLYVGIPFCPTRCVYCSFISQSIQFSSKMVPEYIDALFKEIDYTASLLKKQGKDIETVYIGGGTPTSLCAEDLERLLTKLKSSFDLSKIKEFTVEAGRPDTITKEKLIVLKKNGVTRISINPQTMNEKTLKTIGRNHTPEDIVSSYRTAIECGFEHINMDLIAGLPGEDIENFKYTLSKIKELNPSSITVHTMSIKRGSFLAKDYDTYSITSANTVNDMLDIASDFMYETDREPYYMYRQKNMLGNLENVGYCKKGSECFYNIYIMQEVQSIVSIGCGASTKIVKGDKITRVFNVKEVSEYIKRIDEMLSRKDDIIF